MSALQLFGSKVAELYFDGLRRDAGPGTAPVAATAQVTFFCGCWARVDTATGAFVGASLHHTCKRHTQVRP